MSVDVVVIGRVGVDLGPGATRVALEDATEFRRSVGGFGGNVATALARLGIRTAIVATVGDDGHGLYASRFLATEGVDVSGLRLDAANRTPVAFYELWPPDRFPVTFYPSPAYWAIDPEQISGELLEAPLMIVSATALAWEPSRSVVRDALGIPGDRRVVLDLDWRPALWADPDEAGYIVGQVIPAADVVIGSIAEFGALGVEPHEVAWHRDVYLKRGADGASFIRGAERIDAAPIRVDVVSGLGSGDAFAAAVGEGLVRGRDHRTTLWRANAAGAIVATRLTCSDSMPTNAEIDALLEPEAVASSR